MIALATPRLSLPAGTVQVWHAEVSGPARPECRAVLSAEERGRVDRLLRPVDRNQRTLTFYMTRVLLGGYLGCAPQDVPLLREPEGKPVLPSELKLEFNLSHAQDGALLAVGPVTLGVDLEYAPRSVDFVALAQRFFNPREARMLTQAPSEAQRSLFFSIWTRKEAYIKALGTGLRHPLDLFSVLDGLTDVAGNPLSDWSLCDLTVPWPGYYGALVTRAPALNVRMKAFREFP